MRLKKRFLLLKFSAQILSSLSGRWTRTGLMVMTEHQFLCKNCVLLQYLNHCKFFTKTFSVMYDFLKHGRMLTSFVFLEKVISSWKKTIDLSRYYLFRGKLKKKNIFNSLFEHLHNNLLNNTQMRIPFWRFLCTPAVSNNKQYL